MIWSNVVANKNEYLDRLKLAIEHLHRCGATWRKTVPVHEVFRGQTAWQGDVEEAREIARAASWREVRSVGSAVVEV